MAGPFAEIAPTGETGENEVTPIVDVEMTGDSQVDLAAIEKKLNGTTPEPEPEVQPSEESTVQQEPEQPSQPEAAATPEAEPTPEVPKEPEAAPEAPKAEEIPDKFKNPDGSVNKDAVEKSTWNAQKALAKYRGLETDLRKEQNKAQHEKPKPGEVLQVEPPAPAPAPKSFAARIEDDVKRDGLGVTLERVFNAAKDMGRDEALAGVGDLRQEVDLNRDERELKELSDADPWLLSPEGPKTLLEIRRNDPAIKSWKGAYEKHLVDWAKEQRAGSQVSPNPTRLRAPGAPLGQAKPPIRLVVDESSPDAIDESLARMPKASQDAYWKSKGLTPP